MIVAIAGAPGSFSEAAARKACGSSIELCSVDGFEAVFRAVASGKAARGVVPLRNSIIGEVGQNARLLRSGAFRALGTCLLPIRLCLIARPGTDRERIQRVASHPVALQQCRKLFTEHPGWRQVSAADTATAVRDVMRSRSAGRAAIAGEAAARRYGAAVVLHGVEDAPDNATTFVWFERNGGRSNQRSR